MVFRLLESRYAVIIPLHEEAECIGLTLDELLPALPEEVEVAAGLNGCSDNTEAECRQRGIVVGKTDEIGYGHGCMAAIGELSKLGIFPEAYIFYAGDGANRPKDLLKLIEIYENDESVNFVMGLREFRLSDWAAEFGRALPNLMLGVWCRLMGGKFLHDLGPLRLIDREIFEKMALRELTWGWTIEAQIRAAQLGVEIETIPVEERSRVAGEQKVSGVSMRRSAKIGLKIAAAAWRTAKKKNAPPEGGAFSQGS